MNRHLHASITACVLSMALLLSGCSPSSRQREYTMNSFFFDTVIAVRFYAGDNGEELVRGCEQLCRGIEETFSRTDPDSELYAVNHRDSDTAAVSDEIAQLVETGLAYYETSGGMLDITTAPLSDLWDFKSGKAEVPSAESIAEALEKVDAGKVHVIPGGDKNEKCLLRFDSPDIMLDLGALAKGYAADRLSEYLGSEGVESGLINLGGNVKAIGSRPDGKPWKIGIRKPFSEDLLETVDVRDGSVVTSGVYERCFEKDGILYHHILDPKTGYPVDNGLWSVTILCRESLAADALSTACLAAGREKTEELIRSMDGVEAILALSDGEVLHIS